MALAAVATLAVSAVAAPAPAHAQRGLGAAIAGGLIGGAIVGGCDRRARLLRIWTRLLRPPGYGYYGGPAYVAGPGYAGGCVLAAPAVLGWLWLAFPPRAGLRLIPFTFIKTAQTFPKQRVFGNAYCGLA